MFTDIITPGQNPGQNRTSTGVGPCYRLRHRIPRISSPPVAGALLRVSRRQRTVARSVVAVRSHSGARYHSRRSRFTSRHDQRPSASTAPTDTDPGQRNREAGVSRPA
ncbi:hypothetical protein LSAT2_016612 [Lamellibrachia satsuma]|nr:hypothetical protein LSAT2_016612 [Lamellibrachia satsuma]